MLTLDSTSIFIPTLNAQACLGSILRVLTSSAIENSNIVIVDSSSSDSTAEICKQFGIQLHSIRRDEFNHGKTRNMCLQLCKTDFVVFMTQDALPYNNSFLMELLLPFEDKLVAATYSRQLPHLASKPLEKLDRSIKYPDYDLIQSKDSLSELGSRTYFLSNSCAAYRMSVFRELRGFPENEIMGEDAIYAHKIISKGYKIIYASKSEVYHSHDYNFQELFKRYFDTGVYRRKFLETDKIEKVKGDVDQGSSYAKRILSILLKENRYLLALKFILNLIVSFSGYSLGKKYKLLPNSIRKKISMHSFYWNSYTEM